MDEQQNDQNGQQPVEQNQQAEQPQENIADAPVQPVDSQPRQAPPPPAPSNNLLKFGLIGIGVLVLLFIFFLAFNWRFSRQPGGTPTPTPIQKVVVEPMAQWQTYKAGSMSVKHSATWELDKPEEGIFVTERDSQAEKGTLNPGKGWLEIVRSDKTLDQLKPRGGIDSQKNIEINGQDGVRFEGSNTGIANATYYVQAFFQRNDGLYKVHFFSQDKSLKGEFLKEFDQILSTVSFNEADQADNVSTWQTYTNSKLAYSINHPEWVKVQEGGISQVDGIQKNNPNETTFWMELEEQKKRPNDSFSLDIYREKISTSNLELIKQEKLPLEDDEEYRELTIDNERAFGAYQQSARGHYGIITIHNGYLYSFIFNTDLTATGRAMLSTLKFTQ